jgi:hypothetical protein
MANICFYKVKIKGKRNACYAFFGSMSAFDKWILSEEGTEDETILVIEGNCKWDVDSYCRPWKGDFPVQIPNDHEDARDEAENKYWYYTVQQRSKMFNVEVWCNSYDEGFEDMIYELLSDDEDFIDAYEIDDFIREGMKSGIMCYVHYVNGIEEESDCPEEILFDTDRYVISEDESED